MKSDVLLYLYFRLERGGQPIFYGVVGLFTSVIALLLPFDTKGRPMALSLILKVRASGVRKALMSE